MLYLTAVSSVRGFALTLGVATLLDLFVVWFFKRPTVFLIARNTRLVSSCAGSDWRAASAEWSMRPSRHAAGRRRWRREPSSTFDGHYRGHTTPHFRIIEHRNRWFAFSGDR